MSDEHNSLISRYRIKHVAGRNLAFWINTLKLIFFYRMDKNPSMCDQTQMYILNLSDAYWWSWNVTMVLPSVPYNNIKWHTNFLVIFISMPVDIFIKDIRILSLSFYIVSIPLLQQNLSHLLCLWWSYAQRMLLVASNIRFDGPCSLRGSLPAISVLGKVGVCWCLAILDVDFR